MSVEEYSLEELVDWQNPLNPDAPLNQGMVARYLAGGPSFGSKKAWNLADGSGDTDGTLTNFTDGYGYVGPLGRRGGWGAWRFDGADDYVDTGRAVGSFFSNSTGTMSVWLRPTGPSPSVGINWWAGQGIITDYGTGSSAGFLGIYRGSNGANDRLWVGNWDVNNDYIAIPYTTDEWIHITWVHGGGVLYGYANGNLIGSVASGNTGSMSQTIRFGSKYYSVAGQFFSGYLDDVSIYNRALSSTEVAGLCEASMSYYPDELNRFGYRPKYVVSGFNPALLQGLNSYIGIGGVC